MPPKCQSSVNIFASLIRGTSILKKREEKELVWMFHNFFVTPNKSLFFKEYLHGLKIYIYIVD